MTRLGLRSKTVLAFGLLFAALTVIGSIANYLLLRDSLTSQREGPSAEAFQAEIEALAEERNLVPPAVRIEDGAPWSVEDPNGGTNEPIAGRLLDDGQDTLTTTEDWLLSRFDPEEVEAALNNDLGAQSLTSPAEFDRAVFLDALAQFETLEPGITEDFFTYLQTLRLEDGSLLFSEEPRGDGDLCLNIITSCLELTQGMAALAVFEIDDETLTLVDDAVTRASDRAQTDALAAQLRISITVALATLALAVGAAWLVTQRLLRPVREVTAAAKAASADSLDRRIDLDGPSDELKELADTFDEMLARLERAFDAHRRFGSNAAHELKTPLAVMRAEIDAARLDAASSSHDQALLDRLERAADRSERLVEALLDLARAEGGIPEATEVDLVTVVGDALLGRATDFGRRQLEIDFDVAETGHVPMVTGDRALIDVLVANLLDNACKYATEGSGVLVGIRASSLHVELRVSNEGQELSPAAVGELAEPFRRGQGRSGRDGAGLGLSIVAAVARAHDATSTLKARRGGGLVVVVRFDRAEPTTAATVDVEVTGDEQALRR